MFCGWARSVTGWLRKDGLEFGAEDIPVDDLVESGKRLAVFIDFVQVEVDLEETVDNGRLRTYCDCGEVIQINAAITQQRLFPLHLSLLF